MVELSYLKERLRYDPITGNFHWLKTRPSHVKIGSVAGTRSHNGYIIIEIDGHAYCAHVLAWFYVKGSWPEHEVDHRNVVNDDNRWANLRPATAKQNTANKRRYKNNSSGFKGVTFDAASGKWRARYGNGGKQSLGRFKTKEEAFEAYKAAAVKTAGEFARFE